MTRDPALDDATSEGAEGDWICGEAYDHKLRVIDERDGMTTYECRECGAEIFEEEPTP